MQPPQKKEKSILSFFSQNYVQQNTPRVVSPPPVHAAPVRPHQHESTHHPESTTQTPISDGDKVIVDNQPHPCLITLKLMRELKVGVEAMPKDTEPSPLDHPLAAFSRDPAKCILGIVEDNWEDILNPRMKQAFGWGENRVRCDFVQRGEAGLGGFLKFMGYFVDHHGLLGVLIETKVTIFLDAIAKKYVS